MKLRYFFTILFVGVFLPLISMAGLPALPPVADVPIDGGLSLLLAAGVGYGVKKYRDQKKKK